MRRAPALAAVLTGTLLLSGCAADVRGELRRDVADITDDANARDVDGVRSGVADLLERLDGAVASGELSSAEAARIAELANQLSERADLLAPEVVEEPTEEPSPAPTEEPEDDDEPSPSPSPSRAPSPSPSPSPEPEPTEQTEQPEPVDPTLVPELPTG